MTPVSGPVVSPTALSIANATDPARVSLAGAGATRAEGPSTRNRLTTDAVESPRRPELAMRTADRRNPAGAPLDRQAGDPEDPRTLAGPPPSFVVSTLEQQRALRAQSPAIEATSEIEEAGAETQPADIPAATDARRAAADFGALQRLSDDPSPHAFDVTR